MLFTCLTTERNERKREHDRKRWTEREGCFDFQCVQMAEQNRRAGEQSGSDRETGPKSQLIRDHSQCEKTNEQACFKK